MLALDGAFLLVVFLLVFFPFQGQDSTPTETMRTGILVDIKVTMLGSRSDINCTHCRKNHGVYYNL